MFTQNGNLIINNNYSQLILDQNQNITVITENKQWSFALSTISAIELDTGAGNDQINFHNLDFGKTVRLTVLPGDTLDAITFVDNSSVFTYGGNIDITGTKVSVGQGAVISTRKVISNPITGLSTGDSGAIIFNGNVMIGSEDPGANVAKLLTNANNGYQAGDITFKAEKKGSFSPQMGLYNNDDIAVEITLHKSEINAGNINFYANVDTANIFETGDSAFLKNIEPVVKFLDSFTLIAGVARTKTRATINLSKDSKITATNLEAQALTTSLAATSPVGLTLGVGVGIIDAKSEILVEGEITTTGNLSMLARNDNTLKIFTESDPDPITKLGFAAAVAVSVLDSEATAKVANTAKLNVGGDLNVYARTISRNLTTALSATGEDGSVGLAFAFSDEENYTNALVDGTAIVTGSTTIQADQARKATEVNLGVTVLNGVAAGAGVNSTSRGNLLTDTMSSVMPTLIDAVKKKLSSKTADAATKSGGQAQSLDLGSAVAIADYSNNVTARIGAGATVKSQGDISINAKVDSRPDVGAGSAISDPSNGDASATNQPAKVAISAAVAIGDYKNNAYAYIDNNAIVDAQKALTIKSEAVNDFQLSYGVNLFSSLTTAPEKTYDSNQSGSVTVKLDDIIQVADGHEAGGEVGNFYQFLGVQANIDLSKEDFSNSSRWQDLGSTASYKAKNFVQNLTTYLDGNLGLDNDLGDSFTQSTAKGDKFALAGAVTILSLDQISQAYIGENAKINQDSKLRSKEQIIAVEALNINESLNLIGNIETPGISGNIQKLSVPSLSVGGAGTGAQGSAVGGSVLISNYRNQVTAKIAKGVQLYGDSLKVNADNKGLGVAIAVSGGSAGTFGANGSVVVVDVDNITTAQVEDGAKLTIGKVLVKDEKGNDLNASLIINANDLSLIVNIVGGVVVSNNVGIGASVSINNINRQVNALIGNLDGSPSDSTLIDAQGNIDIKANAEGELIGLSLAAAVVNEKKPEPPTPPAQPLPEVSNDDPLDGASLPNLFAESSQVSNDQGNQGKYGLAISGDVSINQVNHQVRAYINDAGTIKTPKDITIDANNNTNLIALSGSAAIVTKPNGQSAGLAGSVSLNLLTGETKAYIAGNAKVNAQNLTLDAYQEGDIFALTAAASATMSQQSFAVAGSVAINKVTNTTEASVNGATVTLTQHLTSKAKDDSGIIAIGGSLAYGGKAGIGASVAVNTINSKIKAAIANTTLNQQGNLTLEANNQSKIVAITASIGASQTIGGAGTVSVNEITATTAALLDNVTGGTANPAIGGNTSLKAQNNSAIWSLAGAVGIGKTGGLGAAVAYNKITDNTYGRIRQSNLTMASGLSIHADSDRAIWTLSLGVGGGKTGALGGSVSINLIDGGTEAYIDGNSNITAKGEILAKAATDDEIHSLSGGFALASQVAIGAAGAYNEIDTNTRSYISSSTVKSQTNQITLDANSNSEIESLSVSGAGAGTSAIAGSVSINQIDTEVAAYISKNANVSATGAIQILALDDSRIASAAGQVAIGGKASIGASVSTNNANNQVKAYIRNSRATANNVLVEANLTAEVNNITVGGAGAGTFALGGSVTVNNIDTQVLAYISNNSTIKTQQNISISATNNATISSLAGQVSASGTASVGAAVAVNNSSGNTKAYISDSSVTSSAGQVKVSANDTSTIKSLSAGASVSGQVALTGSVSVNNINNTTNAHVLNSTITSGSLEISAKDNSTIKSLAGQISVGIGAAGVGAAVAYNNISKTITAYAQNSTITTTGNALISANNTSDIETVAAGLAAGLYAGVSGSLAINQMNNNVSAYIQGGILTAQGSIGVLANSVNTMNTYGGTVGAGLVGIGGTVVINNLENNTEAYIDNSAVDALSYQSLTIPKADGSNTTETIYGLAVQAISQEKLGVGIGTVGVGIGGFAATVAVNLFADNTQAYIQESAINVNHPSTNTEQSVYVKAFNESTIDVKAGALGVGGVGIGAAIDVTMMKNATTAYIGPGDSRVIAHALKDVIVEATTQKNFDSTVVAGAGGAGFAVSGAVSILNIDSGMSSDGQESAADTQSILDTNLNSANGMGNGNISTRSVSINSQPLVKGTTAFITTGKGGSVDVGGQIRVTSQDTTKVDILAGAAAIGGFLGVGGSVGIANVTQNSSAYVGTGSTLRAFGDISIQSNGLLDSNKVKSLAGSAGAVGIGAAVSYLTSKNNSNAYIGAGTTILKANTVNVIAGSSSGLKAEALGASVGAAAVGVVIANAEETGTTQAYVDNQVQIQDTNNLNVKAITKDAVSAVSQVAAGGILAGSGTVPTATVSPTVNAYIGNGANIKLNRDLNLIADVTVDGDSTAKGVNVGGITVGVSLSEVNSNPIINTYVGANAIIDAANVTVQSRLGNPIAISNNKFDPSVAVNNTADTITFGKDHGLQTGNQVTYSNGGGSDIGGISNDTTYNVIAVDSKTVKLGSEFEGGSVDIGRNTIKFSQNHNLSNGDKVIYEAVNGTPVGGLVSSNPYYVKVIDDKTVQLSQNQFVVGFIYKSDNANDQITSTAHGLNTGDRVIYQTSGTALNGLEIDRAYYVIKVNSDNFRLASTLTNYQAGTAIDIGSNNDQHQLFLAPSQAVNLAGIGTAITINNHGFQNNDMVSYQRRTAEFAIVQDLPQNISPGSNVLNKDTDLINSDTFTSANHGFQTNDQVIYTTSGTALGGLSNNTTYYVLRVDDDHFKLLTTVNGAAIDITTAPKNSIHQITAVGLQGLQVGINYYVVNANQNSFQLAATKAGTALALDKSGLTGTGNIHLFNKESVVDLIGSDTGKHNLYLDLNNVTATGSNHQFITTGAITIPSQGDGKFSAHAQAASGALVGVDGTKATLNISPTVTTYIGNGASITTTGNVTVQSLSVAQVTGSTDSDVFGAVAVGASKIKANLTNTNKTYIGSSANIKAQGSVSITSQSDHTFDIEGDSSAGSLITFADAEAHAKLTHNTQTSINDSASIIAGNELLVESSSNTNGNVEATADGIGLYGDADAETKFRVNGTNETNINSNAALEARKLTVGARVENLNVKARGKASGGGFIGNIDAHATVDLADTKAVVNLAANSSLIGDFVNLSATYQNVRSNSTTSAKCFALGGDTDSEVTNDISLAATVWTDSTSQIKAYTLNVESDFVDLTYKSRASSKRYFFDFGSDSTDNTFEPTPTINFNSQVTLVTREANPILIVNQSGQIQQKSDNITATITGTDVIVNDIDNNTVGEVKFIIPSRKSEMESNGKFVDRGVYTISDPTYSTVQIDNYSAKNLIINNINVVNSGAVPQINYNVNVDNKTISPTNPTLQLPLVINPTVVTINNWGTSNLMLQGVMDNPHDRTILYSGGNIFSQGTTQKIITRDLKMTAVNGSIGTSNQRVAAQLIQGYQPITADVPGSNISLSVQAGNSNYLDLTAKSYNSNPVTVDVKQMTASKGEVNIKIGQTTNQNNTAISALYKFTDTLDNNQNIKTGTNIVIDAGTSTTNIDTRNIFFGTSNLLSITTGGFIKANNTASGKLNIQQAVSHQDRVTISALDMVVVNNALVKATDVNFTATSLAISDYAQVQASNNVNLLVGNKFQINELATITATKNVIIQGDYNNSSLIGTTFTVDGLINAQSLGIYGGSNQNTFNIKQLVSTTTINTGGGDDTVNIGSSQSGYTGLNKIQGSLSIYGDTTANNSTINIDNSQDTSNRSGVLTNTNLTGLGMAQGIYYNGFKFLNVKLGQGINNFTILNTSATTNIDGRRGTNNFRVGPNVDTNGNILNEATNGTSIPGINVLGTSNPTTIISGDRNDTFQINRNTASLKIIDAGGNNTITVNTPIYYSTLLTNAVVDLSQVNGNNTTTINTSSRKPSVITNISSVEVVKSRLILLPTSSNTGTGGGTGSGTGGSTGGSTPEVMAIINRLLSRLSRR
ncbi:MAG: beta strand repeat-containing protein [Sphaerospermopsis kisseleviana]